MSEETEKNENDEKLISLVSQYPMLYDLDHKDYYNGTLKDATWEEIARNLEEDDLPMLKKRWNNLRDAYRKALLKRATHRGPGRVKGWRYEEQMQFLVDHFADKRHLLTNLPPVDEEPPSSPEEEKKKKKKPLRRAPKRRASSYQICLKDVFDDDDDDEYVPSGYEATPKRRAMKNYKEELPPPPPSPPPPAPPKADHLSCFFKATEDAVRTFSPILQIEIKSKLASLICEYEMRNIMAATKKNGAPPATTSPCTVTTPSSPVVTSPSSTSPAPQNSSTSHYHSSSQYKATEPVYDVNQFSSPECRSGSNEQAAENLHKNIHLLPHNNGTRNNNDSYYSR